MMDGLFLLKRIVLWQTDSFQMSTRAIRKSEHPQTSPRGMMKPRDRRNEGLSAHERKIMALELPERKENTPVFTNKNKKPSISKSTSTLAETQ